MKVNGERILIFGDSLSHPGSDGAPYIFSVTDGSNRQSSAPGDLLGSMLLEQGAEAVQLDARVGRSAYNFWNREDTDTLIAADRDFAPTKVVVMLGTNDIGMDPTAEQAAFEQIRDTYKGMGAEVWAVGPFAYVGAGANLNNGSEQVLNILRTVFGADKTIDGRPLSINVQRAGDGVHFSPMSAAPTAANIATALANANPISVLNILGWALVGIGGIVALSWGATKFDAWREGHSAVLNGPEPLELDGSGITYGDLFQTGIQDCQNAFDVNDFDDIDGRTGKEIVDKYVKKFDPEMREQWLEQAEDLEKLDPDKAYEEWRRGWGGCAAKRLDHRIGEQAKRLADD